MLQLGRLDTFKYLNDNISHFTTEVIFGYTDSLNQ